MSGKPGNGEDHRHLGPQNGLGCDKHPNISAGGGIIGGEGLVHAHPQWVGLAAAGFKVKMPAVTGIAYFFALGLGGYRGGHAMPGRIIISDACVAEGAAWLGAADARFARALQQVGPLPLRRREGGFAALFDAIVSQQVSVASANAIWARLDAAGLTDQAAVAVASDEEMRGCGLSRQKIRYGKALAIAGIDFDALPTLPDETVIATLVALPGIGRWTAEIYAMFSLGRADVFAPGDLALQEAAKVLFGLEARPTEKQLRAMAKAWSPWRAVAARLLWAYYRVAKSREGIK